MIETERLVLRKPALEDLDRWAEMMAADESARYIGGVQAKSTVWRIVMSHAGMWSLTGVAMFSVIEKSTNRWIGRVGPWQPLEWPGSEVGWGLHPDAWGKGYAFEAACASMEYAFGQLGWTDVIHCINPANEPSKRLARRLGSVLRGPGKLPAPYENEPVELWGQSRDEWVASSNARRTGPGPSGA